MTLTEYKNQSDNPQPFPLVTLQLSEIDIFFRHPQKVAGQEAETVYFYVKGFEFVYGVNHALHGNQVFTTDSDGNLKKISVFVLAEQIK